MEVYGPCGVRRGEGWELAWRPPDRRLRPGVLSYRGYHLRLGQPRSRLELPTGTVTLLFGFEGRLLLTDVSQRGRAAGTAVSCEATAYSSLVSAVRPCATIGRHDGHLSGIEVVLEPWAAYNLLGVAMHDWAGQIVDASLLTGDRMCVVNDMLTAMPRWEERFALLDETFIRWRADGPAYSPRVLWAWRELCRTSGAVPIRHLAECTGWSWRQFEQRFREQIGATAKTAARIMRLQKALTLLEAGRPLPQTAMACGFSDQSHLTREIRAMTGRTGPQLTVVRGKSREEPSALDRVSGQVSSVLV
ncbi:AraC family transcriptional regulator [Streptomyces roseirectus]|uniref:AraC family transcriptional regulator n=1 Tax=Streptomyces roseirectus TaxID=2768066 RepID=A0A7H0I7S4_9ACTN|nr:helix-turn-helix domain-containing protein [Streptomyces roseirectus]QNP68840.1 AraC family transcriptional regulator [Streptomyces roseirectus]